MIKDKSGARKVRCEVCGNENDHAFEVRLGGEKHVFDSFECAMHAFGAHCGYCGCELADRGVALGDTVYCSYACAGEDHVRDYEQRIVMNEHAHL